MYVYARWARMVVTIIKTLTQYLHRVIIIIITMVLFVLFRQKA